MAALSTKTLCLLQPTNQPRLLVDPCGFTSFFPRILLHENDDEDENDDEGEGDDAEEDEEKKDENADDENATN